MYTSVLEYIWPDKETGYLRSKVKVIPNSVPFHVADLPVWNFDGSSTGQDLGKDTEVMLKPVRIYKDPFHNQNDSENGKIVRYLVLCQLDLVEDRDRVADILGGEGEAVPLTGFNTRHWAKSLAEKYQAQDCWFGLEQEYVFTEREGRLIDKETGEIQQMEVPYRWSDLSGEGQGNFYCSVRYPHSECNTIARKHLTLCLKAGISICGLNAEVLPSQWEFQVGPGDVLKVGDDLLMARYILLRLAGDLGFGVSFHPKIISGEWNGSGCHINFSTKEMRAEGTNKVSDRGVEETNKVSDRGVEGTNKVSDRGIEEDSGVARQRIMEAIGALKNDHPKILARYGADNELRLTGKHETSSVEIFNYGVGTRDTSIRVPNNVWKEGRGYIEDRRPASNIDPYLAMGGLMDVVLGPKVYTVDKLKEIGEKLGN